MEYLYGACEAMCVGGKVCGWRAERNHHIIFEVCGVITADLYAIHSITKAGCR
jgi:hypothetical protein